MKLENVQIEIKNKEHYEAVEKRLQELGKWDCSKGYQSRACEGNYKIVLYFQQGTIYGWDFASECKEKRFPLITLDDLYEAKKEKVIKERFEVRSMFTPFKLALVCNAHDEAMEFIKKQESGRYEIKKYYEVVGE